MAKLEVNKKLQEALTRKYWRNGKTVLSISSQAVLDLAGEVETEYLKSRTRNLLIAEPVEKYLADLWVSTGSMFATDTASRIERSLPANNAFDFWEDHFRRYIRERSASKLNLILDTQAQLVNELIDSIVQDAMTEGASIYEVQRALREQLPGRFTEITKYQAERIARTEVISASNTGSFEGAKSVGVGIEKIWSTSGLPGIRQSHLDYEAMGAIAMDKLYAPGLLYPGDPDGSAEEIINCRCTPIYSVDN